MVVLLSLRLLIDDNSNDVRLDLRFLRGGGFGTNSSTASIVTMTYFHFPPFRKLGFIGIGVLIEGRFL